MNGEINNIQDHPDFEFNLRELAGSMGDFGTLFPLAVSYIAINGMNPAGLFIVLGLTNIALGLIYRLPMPLQPKKIVAITAITQKWSPDLIYASGLGLGLLWILLTVTGLLRWLVRITPDYIVRGIQLALGITLAWQALQWMRPEPLLGLVAVVIVLLLRGNRYAPASVVLMVLGVIILAWRGNLPEHWDLRLTLPVIAVPRWEDVWKTMLLAGFAQIPLSISNAIIAPAALIRDYFPKKSVSEEKLMLNMGVMNVFSSILGGMPMCHGAGGLAGQYYFGARTGGAPIMEGVIEILIGLFLSGSIAALMAAFPMPLIAGMMLLVGIQLARTAKNLRGWELGLALATAVLSVATNIGIGFLGGLVAAHLLKAVRSRGKENRGDR
ncbi:MAG TPA: putative sulfate/molybdate transporter [Brevefilum sp.]|nr:putative sulfate/molybdate transporter [Porticoccaceae bacterium]HOE70306.1 putative sulfate/molybdate transporter [Brevefilum sp.]HOR19560.1 putative sulfate/molybdate transporter [Brevefilum sp.]HPL68726.1 putative sulfate/molybdate transporter [Brevefilum sp.]